MSDVTLVAALDFFLCTLYSVQQHLLLCFVHCTQDPSQCTSVVPISYHFGALPSKIIITTLNNNINIINTIQENEIRRATTAQGAECTSPDIQCIERRPVPVSIINNRVIRYEERLVSYTYIPPSMQDTNKI